MSNLTIVPSDLKYSTTLDVQVDYISQAVAMVNTFQAAYDTNGNFNFTKALEIAKDDSRYAVVGTKTTDLKKTNQQVWVSVEQLQNLMSMVEGAAMENWAMFGAAAKAFLNLNAQKNGGYFTIFSQSSSEISYRYNIFNVTQNLSTGSVMSGQLASIDITMQEANANFLALTAGSTNTVEMHFKSLVVVEALQR